HFPQTVRTQPWLLRDRDELPTEVRARSLLNLPDEPSPTIAVLASGLPREREEFGDLATSLAEAMPDVRVRCIAPTCPESCRASLWVAHWPAIECLPVVDLVVGAGGYNTVSECRFVGVPLVALARERLYDRQRLRLQSWPQGCAIAKDSEEAIALAKQRIYSPTPLLRDPRPNGVKQAIRHFNLL
ncbi:MAG: UDP-N-acetylglucosamine--LPS N-acetylglucosamine transferase, partial [Cyanobacteria bacterium J06639_1]